ncbi:4-(cytidine 5'-diphospho)-2-C-methyl-D-erythritol kinase [Candidatus Peregrinibacteria bacterium]|nr:4-(cytidine 5'-diphospho)-2-C-methyl-D-erythritol kinase [Candidatus Peregrinibacteria bacterium]
MPNFIKIHAPAKINLCLDVIKKTSSGYHEIQTIFQEIPEIYDEITIKTAKKSDNLSTSFGPKISKQKPPVQKNKNITFLAIQLLKKTCPKKLSGKFVSIAIKKNIPISSGLGGASSDAAAVLKGLNKLWNLKIPTKKLQTLAAKLGMDVPFFIMGGTALGTHFGEKITLLPPLKDIKFKIFPESTDKSSKTQSAYASLDLSLCNKNSNKTKLLIKILKKNNVTKKALRKAILATIHNDFETLTTRKNLPKHHHLSGSGPGTFTV